MVQNVHPNSMPPGLDVNPIYNPDLKYTENPHYYNNNKVLFELHMERSQRGIQRV